MRACMCDSVLVQIFAETRLRNMNGMKSTYQFMSDYGRPQTPTFVPRLMVAGEYTRLFLDDKGNVKKGLERDADLAHPFYYHLRTSPARLRMTS